MASDVSKTDARGIGFPGKRMTNANVEKRGTANTSSAWTEASPRSGIPSPDQDTHMVLEATGTPSQEGDLTIQCHRAGHPGLEKAGFIWKDETATTPAWYGWDGPQLMTGWEALLFTETTTWYDDLLPHVIRLQSGNLLAVHSQSTAGTKPVRLHKYTASTSTWAVADNLTLDDETRQRGPCLVELPDARVLLFVQTATNDQVDAYYSTDEGSSWTAYGKRILDTVPATADIREIRAAYSGGEVLMMVQWLDGSSNRTASQYASDSLGTAFSQVVANFRTSASDDPESFNVIAGPAGGFIVGYADNVGGAGDVPHVTRRVGSAFVDLSGVEKVTSLSAGMPGTSYFGSLAIYRDEDDALYAVHNVGADAGIGHVSRSVDEGSTWSVFGVATQGLSIRGSAGNPVDYLERWTAVSTGGRAALVSRWVGSSANEDPDSIACVWLGGATTHTVPGRLDVSSFQDNDFVNFSKRISTGADGGVWYPIEKPGTNSIWTSASSGTNSDDLVSPGVLEVDTTTGTLNYTRGSLAGDWGACFAEFGVDLDDGTGDSTADEVTFQIVLSDNTTYEYEIRVRLNSEAVEVWDPNAGANVGTGISTADILETLVHFRIAMDKGNVKCWYSTDPLSQSRAWTEFASDTLTDGGAAYSVDNSVKWGHTSSVTGKSRWHMVGYCFWPGRWSANTPSATIGSSWTSPDDLHPRSIPTRAGLVFDGVRISAVDGPAKLGDSWSILQDAQYPARNALVDVNPSPRVGWRTTGTTEAKVVWDIYAAGTRGSLYSSSIVAYLGQINFKTATLESSTDGSSWTTQATMDASTGFASLRFDRHGDIVKPLKGGSTHKATQYLFAGDMVGGTWSNTTDAVFRRILDNTGGAWTDETSAIPVLRIDGEDESSANSGTCELWSPSMVAVIHEVASSHRYWRVRIPSQSTANSDFRIGTMFLGHFHAFGHQHGRGFVNTIEPVVEVFRLPNGSSRAVKRGPARRAVEISWPDGVDTRQAFATSPVPDYVTGSSAGLPLASDASTLHDIAGMLDQYDGATTPVVFLPNVNRASGAQTITGRSRFLYGRITTGAGRSHVLGDEALSEMDRGDRLLIEEIT